MTWGRSRFAFLAIASTFFIGCFAVAHAPQSVFPEISLARVEVFADAGDLPSEDVRTLVADPMETALGTLPGVRATRTYANPGKLELELDFDPATDPNADLQSVRAAIDETCRRLPVTAITAVVEGPEAEPIVTYAVTSASEGQARLEARLEAATRTAFVGTPELGRTTVFGGPTQAYRVDVDAGRLAARGLTTRDVVSAIVEANEPHASGSIIRGDERLSVLSGESISDVASLAGVTVRNGRGLGGVPLRDLARVTMGEEETGRQASFDGVHAVLLNVYAAPKANAVALESAIEARLPRVRTALPADAVMTIVWDQTRLIVASQKALLLDMSLGAIIALGIIWFFLRDRALVTVAALVLPIALVFTVLTLVRLGLRLDLMTLGGLAIAIGLIIDEVIVVLEAIARGFEADRGTSRRATIARAVRRVAKPLVASTAANIVVFLPLAFLSGIPGFFFRALAITLALALAISIILSLLFAPMLARALGARPLNTPQNQRIERVYLRAIAWSVRRPAIAIIVSITVVAIAIAQFTRTPTDFLPAIDEGQFEIKYAMPPGMTLSASDALATEIERTLRDDPAVEHVARLSGVDTNGYVATPLDAGTIRITLKPARRDSFDAIADRMRNEIYFVNRNVALEIHQLLEDQINDLSGAPEPIQLTVTGPSQDRLARIASNLADHIDDVPGVVDVFDGVTYEPRSVRATQLHGTLSLAEFSDEVRAHMSGIVATHIMSEYGAHPVVVYANDRRALSETVRLGSPGLTTTVTEEDGRRIVRVTAGLEGADLSTTIARIQKKIALDIARLPPNYTIDVGGAVAEQHAAFTEFLTILAVALLLVFGVLVATFDSFRLPLVVLAAVPLTPIGVALALSLTKTPLNVASFMGMLLLVGIVVRTGILLVDSANRRVREGATPSDAMERAATERLRPILMTTFATLGALAPIALGLGAGSEMERPLAIAVIGGIVTATALTLAIVPALYVSVVSKRTAPLANETAV